jgi:hypothetical protein
MRRCFVALEAAFLALTISVNHVDRVTADGDNTTAVDFLVTSDYAHLNDTTQYFVARIIGDTVIAEARGELNKTDDFRIIAGKIVKSSVDWNPGWSYHFQPDTVHFGDSFIEVCDASATYVEENLADVGGALLPDNVWQVDDQGRRTT